MARSQLLSQALSCPAWQVISYTQQGLKWLSGSGLLNLPRGFATVTPSSSSSDGSSNTSSSVGAQQQQQQPPLYAACVLERLPVRYTQ